MSAQNAHQPLFVLRGHSSAVMTCAMDQQGLFPHFLLSGDVDGVVKLWDLELRTPLLSFHAVDTASRITQAQEQKRMAHMSLASNGIMKVGFLAFGGLIGTANKEKEKEGDDLEVYFYTQCRNHSLYVWRAALWENDSDNGCEGRDSTDAGEMSLEVLHTVNVPQHGFCSVPSVCLSCNEIQLAVPHDNDGMISLWNIGWADASKTACKELRVVLSKSFSASGTGAKCGTIMCICYRDNAHLAVAFESGHVTLNNVYGVRLAIVRAFAETALTCVWCNDVLLASSADGQLHCYAVVGHAAETDSPNCGADSGVSLVVQWEASLRKGLGCVALQRHLSVVGSWDNTLRLYDEGSGRVVSILTFHSDTVNEISMVPSAVAQYAAFGYDVRRPRWCAADAKPEKQDESPVFLFASASGDFTIAVWRLDFKVLRAA